MPSHKKKMIAPIVITALFLLYLAVYVVLIAISVQNVLAMILLALPLVLLATALIVILRERIQEIKGGEEDDLSNY